MTNPPVVERVLSSVDLRALSGRRSMLGIDLTPRVAYVVEMKNRGNPLKRLSPKPVVLDSVHCVFGIGWSAKERGEALGDELAAHGITTKSAVTSLRSNGVKVVKAIIPPGGGNPQEWIGENMQKLMGLPVSQGTISFAYELRESDDSGVILEVTFVRKSVLEEYREIFAAAGLELQAIGRGTIDLFTAYAMEGSEGERKDPTIIHIGEDGFSCTRYQSGVPASSITAPLPAGGDTGEVVQTLLDPVQDGEAETSILIAGETGSVTKLAEYRRLTPFGVGPEYALACGLALKGFLPELSPLNLLPQDAQEKNETRLYRALFHRTAIVFGIAAFILLSVPTLGSIFLQRETDALTEKQNGLSSEFAEIASLEQKVAELEKRLEGGPASLERTNRARTLHDIAGVTPERVWLTHISLKATESQPERLTLSGYARSNDLVAEYLRKLGAVTSCTEPELLRSGLPEEGTTGVPVEFLRAKYTSFEITAGVRM